MEDWIGGDEAPVVCRRIADVVEGKIESDHTEDGMGSDGVSGMEGRRNGKPMFVGTQSPGLRSSRRSRQILMSNAERSKTGTSSDGPSPAAFRCAVKS